MKSIATLVLLATNVLADGCKSPSPPPPTPKTSAAPVTDSCGVLSASEIVRKGSSAVSFAIHSMQLMQADEWARDKTLGLDAAAQL